MSNKSLKKPLAIAVGASFAAAMSAAPVASADTNPFGMQKLESGYMQLAEGKCGEGKCGGKKMNKEAKCGEGKCGGKAKKEAKCGEGKCGEKMKKGDGHDHDHGSKKKMEGKCGEAHRKMHDGKCGGKAKKEAKCGEGKCGGMR